MTAGATSSAGAPARAPQVGSAGPSVRPVVDAGGEKSTHHRASVGDARRLAASFGSRGRCSWSSPVPGRRRPVPVPPGHAWRHSWSGRSSRRRRAGRAGHAARDAAPGRRAAVGRMVVVAAVYGVRRSPARRAGCRSCRPRPQAGCRFASSSRRWCSASSGWPSSASGWPRSRWLPDLFADRPVARVVTLGALIGGFLIGRPVSDVQQALPRAVGSGNPLYGSPRSSSSPSATSSWSPRCSRC